eukprot:sb/3465405/
MCREFPGGQVSCDIRPVPTVSNGAIGFACGPGSRAYGSESDRNGIYVKYLKEHIKSNITVTKLLDTVNREIGLNEPTVRQQPHYQSSIIADISLADRVDTTGHTVEFHHRSLLWAMANSLDRTTDELKLQKAVLSVSYTAPFSNVLICKVDPAPNTIILDHDSDISGLELEQLSPSEYEIRHIQRMEQPFIELTIIYGCDSGSVRIDRPLFAKITANRAAFDMNLNLTGGSSGGGSSRAACEAGPPHLATRACPPGGPESGCHGEDAGCHGDPEKLKKKEETDNKQSVIGKENVVQNGSSKTRELIFDEVSRLPDFPTNHNMDVVYPFVGVYLFSRRVYEFLILRYMYPVLDVLFDLRGRFDIDWKFLSCKTGGGPALKKANGTLILVDGVFYFSFF